MVAVGRGDDNHINDDHTGDNHAGDSRSTTTPA
jgi:hypothetical protein